MMVQSEVTNWSIWDSENENDDKDEEEVDSQLSVHNIRNRFSHFINLLILAIYLH